MKEIICPYSWDCGEIFNPQELSAFDYNFVQSAVQKENDFHDHSLSQLFKRV